MKFPVIVCVLVVLSLDNSLAGPSKCPIPVHYKEIGCTPITKDGEECPSSFNCDHLQLHNTTEGCLFKGKVYQDYSGPSELPPCVPYAQCITPEGYFRAGHIDCGHTHHLPSLPGQPEIKCVTIRSGCCPQDVCGEEMAKLTVCHAEDDIHFGGEKWNPKEDKCIECTCDEHFDNSTSIYENKNCKVKECFQEFWHLNEFRSGCGPKFYGADRCCPSDTKCRKFKKLFMYLFIY